MDRFHYWLPATQVTIHRQRVIARHVSIDVYLKLSIMLIHLSVRNSITTLLKKSIEILKIL